MKKLYTLLLLVLSTQMINAQDEVLTFEQILSEPDTFLNGSDGSGEFGGFWWELPNDYNEEFMSWTGWAVSTKTDTETPGFDNQYSAITGGGVDSSQAYAVSYHFVPNSIMVNPNVADAVPKITGAYITNGTYPYLSMRDGDGFAKKFGGASGDDPDFFLLTMYGYDFAGELTDSVEVYLADYRFEDNSQDYILDEWTWVDMSTLGIVQRIDFVLTSSDVGMFGVNTPTYFCIDNITSEIIVSTSETDADQLTAYPNPTADMLTIQHPTTASRIDIYDTVGSLRHTQAATTDHSQVNLSALLAGSYMIVVSTNDSKLLQRIVKI